MELDGSEDRRVKETESKDSRSNTAWSPCCRGGSTHTHGTKPRGLVSVAE